jgi:glucosamine 6-phosphate synthetase-like amidotransferase/phosphosugar isomerase protein
MHGHLAVFNNKKVPLIYIETNDLSHKAIKNLNKINDDYSPNLIIIGNPNSQVKTKFNLNVPCENKIAKAFCVAVIVQLLALEIALKLKRNIDKPKGLDKVVV